ncbi:hypothetical protein FAP59_16745 [Morganella morganii]|nr:hypothetical protein [Morganella morganii]
MVISSDICGVNAMNNKMKAFLVINTLMTVGCIIAVVILYLSIPKLAVFDMKGTTDTFLNQVSKLNLSDSEQQGLIKKYEKSLNAVIKDEYLDKNTVIFVSGAVVSKIDDETKNIKSGLAKKMKGDSDE